MSRGHLSGTSAQSACFRAALPTVCAPHVQDLLRKIQADAAERLALPPGREVAQELPRFRFFLKQTTHRLKLAHQNGRGGLEVCQMRAAAIDCVIRALWTVAYNNLSPSAQSGFPPIALIALGGYGRG